MKRLLTLLILTSLLFVAACSSDKDDFSNQLESYLSLWHEQKFEDMYKMTTKETRDSYDHAGFTDRYQKIYQDLGIEKLEIKTDDLSEDKQKQALKKKTITLPLHVKMESAAGPIDFESKITFKKEKIDDEEKWLVDWNPGLIFPQLKDGGEIGIVTEEPMRGEIIDRNQMPLAINSIAYEVGVVPEKFSDDDIKKLANILSITDKQIEQALNASWVEPNLFVPLKTIAETDEATYDKALAVPGVTFQETTGRVYPAKEAAAHLVGYIGEATAEDIEENKDKQYGPGDFIGKRGLEQLYEDQLRGETGVKIFVKKDDEEDEIIAEQPVKDGETIQLTIDVNLQEKVFQSYGDDAGTGVVIDPKSGDALALVSSPSFDPNKFLYGMNQTEREALENDRQQPLINRFSATFAPGSVMKPITSSIGLKNGSIQPNDGLTINGLTWSNGEGWGDYKVKRVSTTEKPVDLTDALIRSDNIYFAMQAVEMGHASFEEGLEDFGFAQDIPFPYPIKKSQISNSGDLKQEVLLANTSYGQGELQMSALHLALSYTPILNGGDMVKPQLIMDADKEIWKKDLLAEDDIKVLKKALREVVTNDRGTANALKDNKVDISGKTGTAELKKSKDDKNAIENSWFVGYPTEEENMLVAMMVEDTKGRGSVTPKKVADIINDWNKES